MRRAPYRHAASYSAVIVAPGGGFRLLSIHKEGTRVAEWLAAGGKLDALTV